MKTTSLPLEKKMAKDLTSRANPQGKQNAAARNAVVLVGSMAGALDGWSPCRLSILRNGNVLCHYF